MRIYEILDEENTISIGALLYFEKAERFIIELSDTLNEWNAPLLFTKQVRNHIFTISEELSLMWVRERIIPPGRQNIDSILKTHHLKQYSEIAFLEISEGRCSQDSLYIKRLDEMPDFVRERATRNITECMITADGQLLCFFANNMIKKTDLSDMTDAEDIDKIKLHRDVLLSAKVGTGGYSVVFNDTIELSARLLYERGVTIPLVPEDFLSFVKKNTCDTSQGCELLGCSRQNMSYMMRSDHLSPIKENVKGNLYLKGDILKNMW